MTRAWPGRLLGLAAGAFAILGGTALFALAALTCAAVFSRYVMDDPIFGIEDVSTMLLVVVVAAAVVRGARHGSHVAVDVLGRFLTDRVSAVLARGIALVGAGIAGTASYALFRKGACGFDCGAFTPNLEILHRPFHYTLAVALLLYALVLLLEALEGAPRTVDPAAPSR